MTRLMVDTDKIVRLMRNAVALLPEGTIRDEIRQLASEIEEEIAADAALRSERTRKGNATRKARGDSFVGEHLAEARELAKAVRVGRKDQMREEVQGLLRWHLERGYTYDQMAAYLRSLKHTTPNGKLWTKATLWRVLNR